MRAKTPREVELSDALVSILKDLGHQECHNLHHKKSDRHDYNETCPVEARLNMNIESARMLVARK